MGSLQHYSESSEAKPVCPGICLLLEDLVRCSYLTSGLLLSLKITTTDKYLRHKNVHRSNPTWTVVVCLSQKQFPPFSSIFSLDAQLHQRAHVWSCLDGGLRNDREMNQAAALWQRQTFYTFLVGLAVQSEIGD